VASLPAGLPGSVETLDLVLDHLQRTRPGLLVVDGSVVHDVETELAVDLDAMHPVDAAGRLVTEDLCVMVREPQGWVLDAASLCFPSRWRLADKLGRTMLQIHEPVPGYAERIGGPTDRFLDRMEAERPVRRTNWTLVDDDALFLPAPEHRHAPRRAVDPATAGDTVHFRVERQTLRLLPSSRSVLFTIHTAVRPLASLPGGSLRDLAATLRTVPDDSVRYKGWQQLMEPVLAWLDAAIGPTHPTG
jgi:hypothetical protein